jgi:hypothetical protein
MRRCGSGSTASTRRLERKSAGRERNGEVRAWAKNHGIAVSARGRIPASVSEQYEAAVMMIMLCHG